MKPPGRWFCGLAASCSLLVVLNSSGFAVDAVLWIIAWAPLAVLIVIWAIRCLGRLLEWWTYPELVVAARWSKVRWCFPPLAVVLSWWIAQTEIVSELRWRFDEPRLRAHALRVLANPPVMLHGGIVEDRVTLGTIGLRGVYVAKGRVFLLTTQEEILNFQAVLVFVPLGVAPDVQAAPLEGRGVDGGVWMLWRKPVRF